MLHTIKIYKTTVVVSFKCIKNYAVIYFFSSIDNIYINT